MAEATPLTTIKMPDRITGSVDLSRVIRELKGVDDWLHQASLRTPGQTMQLPKTTQSLEDIAALNNISLLEASQRTKFIEQLESFRDTAPRIHMSFAVEPSGRFTTAVISWLRQNIHPLILLEVGLQPTLAAGCMVRTQNKMFDMSLRHRFKDNRHLLVEKIAAAKGHGGSIEPAATAPIPQVTSSVPVAQPAPSDANAPEQTGAAS